MLGGLPVEFIELHHFFVVLHCFSCWGDFWGFKGFLVWLSRGTLYVKDVSILSVFYNCFLFYWFLNSYCFGCPGGFKLFFWHFFNKSRSWFLSRIILSLLSWFDRFCFLSHLLWLCLCSLRNPCILFWSDLWGKSSLWSLFLSWDLRSFFIIVWVVWRLPMLTLEVFLLHEVWSSNRLFQTHRFFRHQRVSLLLLFNLFII